MKITMISEKDVAVLKSAKKIMKKLLRREIDLDEKEQETMGDEKRDWKSAALKYWRFLDEIDSLGIEIDEKKRGISLVWRRRV